MALFRYDDHIQSGISYPVGESILVVPFWKPEFCKTIVERAEEHGDFAPLGYDVSNNAAPGQELRLSKISEMWVHCYKNHWLTHLAKPVQDFYRYPYMFRSGMDSFRDPFIVKYSMNSQRSMEEHHDASILSIMIKLNSEFEGTDLVFPRQGWSNKDIPVGWGVIFPGQLTHPHYTTPLTSGMRMGLTGWIRGLNLKDTSP